MDEQQLQILPGISRCITTGRLSYTSSTKMVGLYLLRSSRFDAFRYGIQNIKNDPVQVKNRTRKSALLLVNWGDTYCSSCHSPLGPLRKELYTLVFCSFPVSSADGATQLLSVKAAPYTIVARSPFFKEKSECT